MKRNKIQFILDANHVTILQKNLMREFIVRVRLNVTTCRMQESYMSEATLFHISE